MYYRHIIKRKKSKTDTITPLLNVVPQVGGGTGGGNPQMTYTLVDYCGNLVYENDTLKQALFEGGYVTFNGTTPQYHFYIQDHQGNNRLVCNSSGSIEQVNHYYPFGGLFGESTNDEVQRYKYNGKELDRMHGLNLYDYHARQYDGAMGQFTTMNPLCERYNGSQSAHVIDKYKLISNNCTTFVSDVLNNNGSNVLNVLHFFACKFFGNIYVL